MTKPDDNPLRRELAAIAPAGEHPDSDVLSAFAEGVLLEAERGAVLAHLAGCAECREVLILIAHSAPPGMAEVKQFPVRQPKRIWMPWGAVAAGIAVACGVAVYRVETRPVYAPTVAQTAPARPAAPPEIAELRPPANELEARNKKTAPGALTKTRKDKTPSIETQNLANLETNRINTDALKIAPGVVNGPTVEGKPKAEARMQARDSLLNEQPASAAGFASPAAKQSLASAGAIARPHWHLNEQGQPQRAFGDGAWQPALPGGPSGMHVVSVIGDEVWAGGENSQVYRSSDEGETWHAVTLPEKDGGAHTIAHIRFENTQSGTIEAMDGTTWHTEDGGRTWQ